MDQANYLFQSISGSKATDCWPNSENSKLVKALTVPKVTSRNQDMQLGLTGIGRRAPPRRVSQGSGSAPPVSV